MDRPVVRQEEISDPGKALAGLVVVHCDRLVRPVAARHHQRAAEIGEQQVMERGVREHDAEPGDARRRRVRDRRVGPPP